MKQQVIVERSICDFCGSGDTWLRCLSCSRDVCWHCYSESTPLPERKAIRYSGGVCVGGSNDGVYCIPCDLELSKSKCSPLHQAFVAIRALRDERQAWSNSFEKRCKLAEAQLQRLR
jgi:hypothetical protein